MTALVVATPGAFAQSGKPVLKGHYVRVESRQKKGTLSLAEVQVFSKGQNVALKGKAVQSSTAYDGIAHRAIDGNTDGDWGNRSVTHTEEGGAQPAWEVDLGEEVPIDQIIVWNRTDGERARLDRSRILVLTSNHAICWEAQIEKAPQKSQAFTVADGKLVPPGKPLPALVEYESNQEIVDAYQKKGTWFESVMSTTAKLGAYRDLKVLVPLLMRDFPREADEIEFELKVAPVYHNPGPKDLSELAARYVRWGVSGALRTKADVLAKTASKPEDIEAIRKLVYESQQQTMEIKMVDFFNPVAVDRAIKGFAASYPDRYKDADSLSKTAAEVAAELAKAKNPDERLALAPKVRKLMANIYSRHPGVDFKELLYVRRGLGGERGLPANYSVNSGLPRGGYLNSIVRAPLWQGASQTRTLINGTEFLGDISLDYDGQHLLFSQSHEKEGNWSVMEIGVDGSNLKSITPNDQKDIDFYDACYLPDGRKMFVGSTGFQGVPCVGGSIFVGNLHLMEKDGSIRRITFEQDNDWTPTVMPNGRVMYLRWEYEDSAHYFSRVLMTMNPDGTDQKEFYGSNSYWPNSLFYAKPLPGSSTKFAGIASGHHGVSRIGKLVLFDVSKGRHEVEGAVQEIPGYGKPVMNVTKDGLYNDARPMFTHSRPLGNDLFLASVSPDGNQPFMICFADIYDNIFPVIASPTDHLFEAVPLRKSPRPTLPMDRFVKTDRFCNVFIASVYNGPGLEGIPRGKVKALRVFAYEYSFRNMGGHDLIGMEGPWDPRNILGTVNLETDGSVIFRAPANTPIAIQPLDENGSALQQFRSWFTGMPGETVSCAGCHEKQNSVVPARASIAARKSPQAITPWNGPRRGYAFEREVQSVLDQACVGCHNARSTAKNKLGEPIPDFTFGKGQRWGSNSYSALHPYVRRNGPEGDYHLLTPMEFHVSTSELIQVLDKGHHGVKLTPEQRDRLVTWIDLNVPFYGTWTERGAKQHWIERRRQAEKQYANLDYNPEEIVNPYQPAEYKAPAPAPVPAPATPPTVPGWPFDATAAKAMQKAQPLELDLGGGQKIKLSGIPAGEFIMGSNDESPAEQPMSRVKIDQAFWMGTTEITMAQFQQFDPNFENGVYDMRWKDQTRRGYFMNEPEFPAIRITWEKANAFCDWLSKKTGRKVALPTEAQWEWACRAGTATPMNYGDFNTDFSANENLADASLTKLVVTGVDPKPMSNPPREMDYELRDKRFNDGVVHLAKVGSYKTNAWGLHDMHGNVAEWTRSAYRPYPYSDADGRNNANTDELKVVRGGSWYQRQHRATSSWRLSYPGWQRVYNVGFRVVVE